MHSSASSACEGWSRPVTLTRPRIDDPQYRQKLLHDMRKRRVLPAVETMLWYYAKGKPVERHEIATPGDFSKLSDDELLAQFDAMVMSLRAERRVEGEKELLSASVPTTV